MPTELAAFIVSKTATGLSPATVKWYAMFVRLYATWAHGQGLQMEKPETVEGFMAHLRTGGRSAFTISGCYRALSVYFAWLVQRRKLRRSPMSVIPKPQTPTKRVRFISATQFQRLYDSVPDTHWWQLRDRAILLVLFYTGLRANELLGLRLESIDRDRMILLVSDGKGGKDRDVPCAPMILDAIDLYVAKRPAYNGSELFLSRRNSGSDAKGPLVYDGLKQMLRRRCRLAGLPQFSAHKFRHAYAMVFANAGMPLSALAATMGHSSVAVTEKFYARWQTENLSAVYNKALARMPAST
jgi:integrase/recombinase XerD